MTTIGFSGHRDATADPALLEALAAEFPETCWLHGGAPGFDSQVHAYACAHDIPVVTIRPRYREVPPGMSRERWVKLAPLKRNEVIVERADLLVACYDGRRTGGTFYTVEFARKLGKPVRIWDPPPPRLDRRETDQG